MTITIPRRDFLKLAGLATAGLAFGRLDAFTLPMTKDAHSRTFTRGKDLTYIGLPVGGICAGQVYLGGDGRLWLWDVFNKIKLGIVAKEVEYRGGKFFADGGANYIEPPEQVHPFDQGFAIRVDGKVRPMDATGWKDVAFSGEYPMGFVEYRDPSSPVSVTLEAFSPFIPLDAEESGLPAVVMRYRIKNESAKRTKVDVGGWMENPVGLYTVEPGEGIRTNKNPKPSRVEFAMVEPPRESVEVRPPVVFETWDKPGFGGWTVIGTAFGKGPIKQATTAAARSYRLEEGDTNVQSDARTGKLVSRKFTLDRRFVEFWISGGNHPQTARIDLVVDGKAVRTATGRQTDLMRLDRFGVEEFAGKTAHLEIVDEEPGFWGQIAIGGIAFVDEPSESLATRHDFGEMTLALLDVPSRSVHGLAPDRMGELFEPNDSTGVTTAVEAPAPYRPMSGLLGHLTLAPGEEKTATFVIAWRFPNLTLPGLGRVGNHYATRFASSGEVVEHIERHQAYLGDKTRQWHDTWYDSTLPRWFLDRTMIATGILATMTVHRFGDGRFYGWEGVCGCEGTCGHVWGYAQSVSRLFPSLERSRREDVDYGICFNEETGVIPFRSEFGFGYAADAQSGYILRTYREHTMSPDDGFLKRVYPHMKKALEFLVGQDGDSNGVLEGRQHNTLDVDLYGPSSWLTSYYLAALRAGEEMAKEMGDAAFAERCRAVFDRGSKDFDELFWNGDYFIHRLPKDAPIDSMRIGDGCHIDQLMGQWWAHQLGLGRITDEARSRQALKAIVKNNLLQDVGPYRDRYKPGRWYAMPGEPGTLMCTFPKGDRAEVLGNGPTWASMYFNECWTGQEHMVAGHMIKEGLVDEGLAVMKAVHERHHPSRRNPYNEVEYSDHYSRSMSVFGAYLAATGYEVHGPKGHIGFAPKIGREDFRAAFTAVEGWGTYRQKVARDGMEAGVKVRHGSLRLKTLGLEIPLMLKGMVRVTVDGKRTAATMTREGSRATIALADEVRLEEGDELIVTIAS